MTLPERCYVCGALLNPWDQDTDAPCRNCGATSHPYETLSPAQRRLILRILQIDTASVVRVNEAVL